jgi:hypothetical protein
MNVRSYREEGNETPAYRSKAEVQIARLLDREGIGYRYEQPLAVLDRDRTRIWYPDFYLPEYGMIIEYFGMNDDPGYRQRTEHKLAVYRQSGIEGVFLTEASLRGDWPARILGQIESVLQERMERFYRRRPGRRVSASTGVGGITAGSLIPR